MKLKIILICFIISLQYLNIQSNNDDSKSFQNKFNKKLRKSKSNSTKVSTKQDPSASATSASTSASSGSATSGSASSGSASGSTASTATSKSATSVSGTSVAQTSTTPASNINPPTPKANAPLVNSNEAASNANASASTDSDPVNYSGEDFKLAIITKLGGDKEKCSSLYNFEFDYYKRIHDFCNSLDGNIFNTKLRDFLLKARECLENTNQTPITADEVKRFFIMDSKSNKLVTSIPKTSICSTSNFILDESSVADFIKRTISSIGRGDNRGVTNFSKKRVKDSMNKKMNLNASRDNYFFL